MQGFKRGMLALSFSAIGCASSPKMSKGLPIDINSGPSMEARYTQNGVDIDAGDMASQIEMEPNANFSVGVARGMRILSVLFAAAGGALIGVPLGQEAADVREPLWPLVGAGAGAIALSVPFAILSVYNMDNAVKSHNATLAEGDKRVWGTGSAGGLGPSGSTAAKPAFAAGPPPAGAAGFAFGEDAAASEARCTAASLVWQRLKETEFSCSGAPADVGVPATVSLTTCAGAVCRIAVNASSDGAEWSDLAMRFDTLSALLVGSHGSRAERKTKRLEDCIKAVPACFAAGRVRKSATWRWQDKQSVLLVLSGGPVEGPPKLTVFYYAAAYEATKPKK